MRSYICCCCSRVRPADIDPPAPPPPLMLLLLLLLLIPAYPGRGATRFVSNTGTSMPLLCVRTKGARWCGAAAADEDTCC